MDVELHEQRASIQLHKKTFKDEPETSVRFERNLIRIVTRFDDLGVDRRLAVTDVRAR